MLMLKLLKDLMGFMKKRKKFWLAPRDSTPFNVRHVNRVR